MGKDGACPLRVRAGCYLEFLGGIEPGSVDLVLTDPALAPNRQRIGPDWDPVFWREVRRILKPRSGVVCSFGDPGSEHHQAVAMEKAGLQILETMIWVRSRAQGVPQRTQWWQPERARVRRVFDIIRIAGRPARDGKHHPGHLKVDAGSVPCDNVRPCNVLANADDAPGDLLGGMSPALARKFFTYPKPSRRERTAIGEGGKPAGVMEALIRLLTSEGALVVDPFCWPPVAGVATAWAGEGRVFLGCCQDEGLADQANERLAAAWGTSGIATPGSAQVQMFP